MNPITVGQHTYTSIAEAWRETGMVIPLITLRWRLRMGWHPEDAFSLPVVSPQDRRTFAEVRSKIGDVEF